MDFQTVLYENTLGIRGLEGHSKFYDQYRDSLFTPKSTVEESIMGVLEAASSIWDEGLEYLSEEAASTKSNEKSSFKDKFKEFFKKVKEAFMKILTGFNNMIKRFIALFKEKKDKPINNDVSFENVKEKRRTTSAMKFKDLFDDIEYFDVSTIHPKNKGKFLINIEDIDRDLRYMVHDFYSYKTKYDIGKHFASEYNFGKDSSNSDKEDLEELKNFNIFKQFDELSYDCLHKKYTKGDYKVQDIEKILTDGTDAKINKLEFYQDTISTLIKNHIKWLEETEKEVDKKIEEAGSKTDYYEYDNKDWTVRLKFLKNAIQVSAQTLLKNDANLTRYIGIVADLFRDEYTVATRVNAEITKRYKESIKKKEEEEEEKE